MTNNYTNSINQNFASAKAEIETIKTAISPLQLSQKINEIIANINQGPSRQVGEIVTSTVPLSDAGLHLLDGALLQYASYKNFIDYIASIYSANANYFCSESDWQTSVTTYGVCGKFVYDSVNNTVRLPKVTGFVEGASGTATLGDLTEAGLPNITGTFASAALNHSYSGAFYESKESTKATSSSNFDCGFGFDASLSNSIYGNSNTVQPQSVKVLYYIVVATMTKTEIEVDIDEIATDLNGKADTDLSNTSPTSAFATAMNTAGIRTVVETYVNGASWYRVYSDKWCEQGGNTQTSSTVTVSSITFLKQFSNTNYTIIALTNASSSTGYAYNDIDDKTASSCIIRTSANCRGHHWYACGYIN